jgi:DNA-directed RNA polymerase specialized sigma24 family protein
MSHDAEGTVTHWLAQLKAGNVDAVGPLWDRYFDRLVRLARKKLCASLQRFPDEDEEDVALSAFHSFCTAARRGRFPRLNDRDDLWRVLVCVTARKVVDQMERRSAQKRGGRRVRLEADLNTDHEGEERWSLDRIIGAEPSPDFAAQIAEEFQQRIESLPDPMLKRIALLRFACQTNEEIAQALGCSLRTVTLRVELIRKRWENEAPS